MRAGRPALNCTSAVTSAHSLFNHRSISLTKFRKGEASSAPDKTSPVPEILLQTNGPPTKPAQHIRQLIYCYSSSVLSLLCIMRLVKSIAVPCSSFLCALLNTIIIQRSYFKTFETVLIHAEFDLRNCLREINSPPIFVLQCFETAGWVI